MPKKIYDYQRVANTQIALQNLLNIIRRLTVAAESDDPTSTKKMLEIGVEVQPALEALGKAKKILGI